MKMIIVVISLIILTSVLYSCKRKDKNITFTAVINEIGENNLIVTTDSEVGFDKANVKLLDDNNINPDLLVGQTVEIEIEALPQVMDSDIAQVIAVNIKAKPSSYKKISPDVAKKMMNDKVIIVDVRSQSEYNTGYIENALLIPGNNIKELATKILPDLNATILVYCRSGNRSKKATKLLIDMGYQNVYDFGGINNWNYKLVTP